MVIRKITFDNGDIVLAKDQAILYDLLLKQQTKTLLPNGETIYQNSTGFLIQNESEKLKYTYKTIDDGVEFTFNPQLYLSVCGRIIKLEKDSKCLFDWNDIEKNETYYVIVKIDLSKKAKIINNELKEFGNLVEVKLINIKEKLTQDNLNQKSNDGIYEFPLISFIRKYNTDNSWEIKTKDESTYLLPLLMGSTCSPSKLLTITQKVQEEKELLQEKQNQVKDIKNYLTNLEYIKTQELKELEEYIQNQLRKFKKVYSSEKPFKIADDKWYIIIWRISKNGGWNINKFINWQNYTLQGIDLINNHRLYRTLNSLEIKKEPNYIISNWNNDDGTYFKSVYRWYGEKEPDIEVKTIDFFDLIK